MTKQWSPVVLQRTEGRAPIVLVCEHASPLIPRDFAEMDLNEVVAGSHAVWDVGALNLAGVLSEELDAPLVSCGVSRALYDCNRPFTARDCIPVQSERFIFEGNRTLSEVQKKARYSLIHDLFHEAVKKMIEIQGEKVEGPISIITIHTFTPIYNGESRSVEIGYLYHDNAKLSVAAQRIERQKGRYLAELNQPYDKSDGVTYSLFKHSGSDLRQATMIEVRSDLVDSEDKASVVGAHLADTLRQALANVLSFEGAAV